MKEYTGLNGLRRVGSPNVFCPQCEHILEVVPNGFFHGEVFFCPGDKTVFTVSLRRVKASQAFINQCESDAELETIRKLINTKNMAQVKQLINDRNK